MPKHLTVDNYVSALATPVQKKWATDLRQVILAAAPQAEEAMRYYMPSFRIEKSAFLYFARWKKHVGLYPIYKSGEDFEEAVGPYRAKRDTVQFRYSEPFPNELVTKIVLSQLAYLR
jgi:uncharacterized protein YdhG (YjbR/CyaY superfamily)